MKLKMVFLSSSGIISRYARLLCWINSYDIMVSSIHLTTVFLSNVLDSTLQVLILFSRMEQEVKFSDYS